MGDTEHNEHSVQIEREKTKRTFALIIGSFVTITTVIVLFIYSGRGGKVEGPGFKIDIPLIDQVQTDSEPALDDSGSVTFTTSAVPDSVVESVATQETSPLRVDTFTGKNLIDRKAGFIIASEQPASWNVRHSDAGYTSSDKAIVQLRSASGTTVDVHRYFIDPAKGCSDLDCMVERIMAKAREQGAVIVEPKVTKDKTQTAALIVYRDQTSGAEVYVKCVIEGKWWYEARADIASGASPEDRRQAIKTVTTFSAIAKN